MKYKVSELEGWLLDEAVARAQGWRLVPSTIYGAKWVGSDGRLAGTAPADAWQPSRNWMDGGPLIERERINVMVNHVEYSGIAINKIVSEGWGSYIDGNHVFNGPTPLIAAMRAFVASKLGHEVEL